MKITKATILQIAPLSGWDIDAHGNRCLGMALVEMKGEWTDGEEFSGRQVLPIGQCENEACFQLVIRLHETTQPADRFPMQHTTTRIVYPASTGGRAPAPEIVPSEMRRDYAEACAILDISHRMSAVLARKIVGDLLKKYAGRNEKRLTAQIDTFLAGPGVPSAISSGLHHVREAADMSAHTQEEAGSTDPVVIDIDREEAEWTLDFVERLFDYFIVQPAKDEAIKARIEDKSTRAGRRPLPGTSDDEGAT